MSDWPGLFAAAPGSFFAVPTAIIRDSRECCKSTRLFESRALFSSFKGAAAVPVDAEFSSAPRKTSCLLRRRDEIATRRRIIREAART